MSVLSDNVDFTDKNGGQFSTDLQRFYLAFKTFANILKLFPESGIVNQVVFYGDSQPIADIQNELAAGTVALKALRDGNTVNLWVVSNEYAFELANTNGTLTTINNLTPTNRNINIAVASNLGLTNDPNTSTITIDANALDAKATDALNKANSAIQTIIATAPLVGVRSGDTETLSIDIPGLVSSQSGNQLSVSSSDGKLYASGSGLETINSVPGDANSNVRLTAADTRLVINNNASGNEVSIGSNLNQIVTDVISTDAGNELKKGTDDKLYVQPANINSGITSINGQTGAAQTIVGINGISVTNTSPNTTTIASTGSGSAPDYSFNRSIYIAENGDNAPDGTYDKPYDVNDELQDALDALDTNITYLREKNSDIPVTSTTNAVYTNSNTVSNLNLSNTAILGALAFDISSISGTPVNHFSRTFLKELSGDGVLIQYTPYSIAGSTSADININVDKISPNAELEIFKLIPKTVTASGIRTISLNIETNLLSAPTSSSNPDNNKALFDFDRGTLTGIDSIHINFVVRDAQFNPTVPSQPHNIAINKGPNDTLRLSVYDNIDSFLKNVNIQQADTFDINGVLKESGIFSEKALKAPIFDSDAAATDPFGSSSPVKTSLGDLYYNSTSNTVKYYNGTQWKEFSSGGSNPSDTPIPDTVYYDDNSTSATEDGTIDNPFKTLQGAITDASTKAETNSSIWRVRAKDGASREVTESITIGGTGKSIAVEVYLENITFKNATFTVDVSNITTVGLDELSFNCDEWSDSTFDITGATQIPSADANLNGAKISMYCNFKRYANDTRSFSCDLSSLSTANQKLAQSFIEYNEVVDNGLEIEAAQNSESSIAFIVNPAITSGLLSVKSNIRTFSSFVPSGVQIRAPYIAFSSSDNTQDINTGVTRDVTVQGIAKAGIVYSYIAPSGATSSAVLTSELVKSSRLEADSGSITALNSDTITADKTLIMPSTNATGTNAGAISLDPVNNTMQFYDNNNKKHVVSTTTGTSDTLSNRFHASHSIVAETGTSSINMPDINVRVFDEQDRDERHNIITPAVEINCRETVIDTLPAQAFSIDTYDFTANPFYAGKAFLKLTDITGATFTTATDGTTNELLTTVAITLASGASDIISKGYIIAGTSVRFANSANLNSVSICVKSVSSASDTALTIIGYSNLGHGDALGQDVHKPLADDAAANAITTWNVLYLGDKFDFDPSKTLLQNQTPLGKFFEMHYHPVLFQAQENQQEFAIILVGFNARLSEGDTFGKRSFAKKHVSKKYVEFFTQQWGSTKVYYQQLSLFFKCGIPNTTNNGDNNFRQVRGGTTIISGNTYETTFNIGVTGEERTLFSSPIAYSQIQMLPDASGNQNSPDMEDSLSAANSYASMVQDEASVESIDSVQFPDFIAGGNNYESRAPFYLASVIRKNGTTDNNRWTKSLTGYRGATHLNIGNIVALGAASSTQERTLDELYEITATNDDTYATLTKIKGKVLMLESELITVLKENDSQQPQPEPSIERALVSGTSKDINLL